MAKTRIQIAIEEGRVRLVRDELVTVGTTATQLCKSNPKRTQILISNPTSASGRVSFDKRVSSTRGVPLVAATGVFQQIYGEDGEAVFKEIFGVLDVSGDVHVLEWEAYDG